MSRGHVFITMGDITHMEVDAWLLPTDRELQFSDSWAGVPDLVDRRDSTDTAGLRAETVQAVVLEGAGDEPQIVLATVPLAGVLDESGVEHVADSVRDFVRVAIERIRAPRHGRTKPLLALPSFGTGDGGGAELRGELAAALLKVCAEAASEHDVDIAIVLRSERSFARMQELRKRRGDWHRGLSREQYAEAGRLADLAKAGRLVPFLGAGTSMSAGAPSWSGLLDILADGLELDPAQRKALAKWSELDRAAFLRQRALERRADDDPSGERAAAAFAQEVARLVDVPRYGLTPALLASLRTPQAITLNYDCLFEKASDHAGAPRVTIPSRDGGPVSGPWLLKLHGSVDKPESIVLTRDDYLGYAAQRDALSAIVKANLLTHHLLFVGFSLSDEHFHRIVHDVRRALPSNVPMEERATALTLSNDPIAAKLWEGQVRMRPVGSGRKRDGRAVEIFLDVLVALATDAHSYLLDQEFATSLSPDEVRLGCALQELRTAVDEIPKRTAGRANVEALLGELGGRSVI